MAKTPLSLQKLKDSGQSLVGCLGHLHRGERALQAFHAEAKACGVDVRATQDIESDLRKIRALIEGYLVRMSVSLRPDGSYPNPDVDEIA